MALIVWKNTFKSGHPSVDHEHQTLISTINEMHSKISDNCSQDTVRHYLGEIHAMIEAHFALEEKIMRDIAYQNYGAHKADHERLLEEIRDIMESVTNDADVDCNQALANNLNRWFGIHFTTLDRDFHSTYPD